MTESLPALYTLQLLDSALDKLKTHYSQIDVGTAEKEAFDRAKAIHQEVAAVQHKLTSTHKDLELEAKGTEEKRLAEEKKLYGGKVTNSKELQSLTDEVASLERRKHKQDGELISLMEQIEAAKNRTAEVAEHLGVATEALKSKRSSAKSKSEELMSRAKETVESRNKAAAAVDAKYVKEYERLRGHYDGIAITIVHDNACNACRMALPSNIVRSVKSNSEVVYCLNCRRIIIAKPTEA